MLAVHSGAVHSGAEHRFGSVYFNMLAKASYGLKQSRVEPINTIKIKKKSIQITIKFMPIYLWCDFSGFL